MKSATLAFALVLAPALAFAQTAAASDSSEYRSPNCKWAGMKGISSELSVTDFLDQSIVGDWMNYTQAGLMIIPARNFSMPIQQVPPEVITITEKNNKYFARNAIGSAEIEIREFKGDDPSWDYDGRDLGNPFGTAGKKGAVIKPGQLELLSGCTLEELPLLIGTGRWESPKGAMDVTLYFVPASELELVVVMEGIGKSAEGTFIIRRGYAMHRLEAVPLTED